MGARVQEEHFIQDAAEKYWVWQAQEQAIKKGVSSLNTSDCKQIEFEKYCSRRNVVEEFKKSPYKQNIDSIVEDFLDRLTSTYPDEGFEFIDIEKEQRNEGLKGDFLIRFSSTRKDISVSLKNYKQDVKRFQLCSGTFPSFLNNIVFDKIKDKKFKDSTGQSFIGTNKKDEHKDRKEALERDGLTSLLPFYEEIDKIHQEVTDFYIYNEEAEFYEDIKGKLKEDRSKYGNEAASIIVNALNCLSSLRPDMIKKKMLKWAGWSFNNAEEILFIGKNENYLCSLFDNQYQNLICRLNSDGCKVVWEIAGQGVKFTFSDEGGEITSVLVPCTLNQNGAWAYCGEKKFEGTKPYEGNKDNGIDLAWGQRRPTKSKEFATSTNTFWKPEEAGCTIFSSSKSKTRTQKGGKRSTYDWSKLHNYIDEDLTISQIAEKVGCSYQAAYNRVKKIKEERVGNRNNA